MLEREIRLLVIQNIMDCARYYVQFLLDHPDSDVDDVRNADDKYWVELDCIFHSSRANGHSKEEISRMYELYIWGCAQNMISQSFNSPELGEGTDAWSLYDMATISDKHLNGAKYHKDNNGKV